MHPINYSNPWDNENLGGAFLWLYYEPFAPSAMKDRNTPKSRSGKSTWVLWKRELAKLRLLVKMKGKLYPKGIFVVNSLAPLQYTMAALHIRDPDVWKRRELSEFRVKAEKMWKRHGYNKVLDNLLHAFPSLSLSNILLGLYVLIMQENATEKEIKCNEQERAFSFQLAKMSKRERKLLLVKVKKFQIKEKKKKKKRGRPTSAKPLAPAQ